MRILLVTQMWPGPDAPDLGSFLVPLVHALEELGHEVDVVAITRRGGSPAKYAGLTRRAVTGARRRRPDAVFAHMLFPAGAAGLAAARAAGAPLVVMAHGTDVANLERPALRLATAPVIAGAAAVVVNSRWLGARLTAHFRDVRPVVCDLGVDLDAFAPGAAPEAAWPGDAPRLLCVGSLIERKNVVALADAFAAFGRGSLVFLGDGPLRGALEGRPGVHLVGRVPHDEVPGWLAACDVLCQPARAEPFGQAVLEAMAMERSVLVTSEGGPAEFVTADAGVLVDPRDPGALIAGIVAAATLPRPNPAARAAAAAHDVRRQAARMADVLAAARKGRRG